MTLSGFHCIWIQSWIELAVIDFVWLRSELKKSLLEVEGARAPVPLAGDANTVRKVTTCARPQSVINHILLPSQKPNKVQCNNIKSYRDGGLTEKQVLMKLAAHYILHALLINSHKHTVNQQYKQVKGPNNIIMHHARKLQQLQIYSSLFQSNNNNESIRRWFLTAEGLLNF